MASAGEGTPNKLDPTGSRSIFVHCSDDHSATGLQLLGVADFSQQACDETKQLVERVKSSCLIRCNVLNPALESPSLNIGFGPKLDDESRLVLPSFHQEWTIVRACVVSHKPAVKFR